MSITITQDIEASHVANRSAEIMFTIRGAQDESAAAIALGDQTRGVGNCAPKTYHGLYRISRRIEAVHIVSTAASPACDKNIFKASVTYSYKNPASYSTSFDTTGGSQHITQSFNTIGRYPQATAPNMQGAIGYDGEKVSGVDIIVPVYNWTEVHWLTQKIVTTQYRMNLALWTGAMNNSNFRGFAAGEVQFRGVSGQKGINEDADDTPFDPKEGPEQWQLTFSFAASPNRQNLNVGGIVVAEKYGWDYLWTLYTDKVDSGRLVQHPVACYVERLYPFIDFAGLHIGTDD